MRARKPRVRKAPLGIKIVADENMPADVVEMRTGIERVRVMNVGPPAPDMPIDQAWGLWWRGLCAKHGHESRLHI